jgi:hypothetical protein
MKNGQRTRRGRVRRIVLRVAVLLLLGAVVNVAVAWGCVCTIDWSYSNLWLYISDNDTDWWQESAPSGFRAKPERYVGPYHALGVESRMYWAGTPDGGVSIQSGHRVRTGFPFRSLEAEQWSDGFNVARDEPEAPIIQRGVISAPFLQRGGGPSWIYVLPCIPIWPGFAINTVFYALILWLLLAAPLALRRWRRMRKGLCPKCAYPIGQSANCTECGHHFTSR